MGFEAAFSVHSVTLPWAARLLTGTRHCDPLLLSQAQLCPPRGLSICLPRTVWQINLEPRYAPASTEHAAKPAMPVNSATYTHTRTMHTHSHKHMHTSMHVESCVHKHTCLCMHMHTCLHMCVHIYTLTQRCAYGVHTCAHTCTCSCDCTHVHTYTHIHMQTHALNGRLGQMLALLAHLSFVSLIRCVPPEGPANPLSKVVMPPPPRHGILSSLPCRVFSLTPSP